MPPGVLESQFFNNRETRALYLDAKLRNFVQGDLSITDYCRELKHMADTLRDLGEVVTDRTLVLNLIRGLNEKYKTIGMHLQRGRPFPSFLDAKSDLLLEELTMENQAPSQQTALVATGASPAASPPPPVQQPSTGSSGSGGASAPSKSHRSKCSGRRDGSGQQTGGSSTIAAGAQPGGQHKQTNAPWPSFHNPWAGAIQMWPGLWPPLAPLPPCHLPQQQALLA